MNLLRLFVLLLSLSLASLACSQSPKGETLLRGLLDALNTKDPAPIGAFVQANFDTAIPVDRRVQRLMGAVQQGAPFKLVRMREVSDHDADAVVRDKTGTLLAWTLDLDKDGKIKSVRIQSVDSADAPPPKDYTGWTDLGKLAEAIRSDAGAPAIAISVLHGHQVDTAVAGQRVVGKDDPVKPQDAFSIGSIGKPLCSTLVGILIERHKLRWDTTLGEAFPDVAMKPGYKAVTVDEILHHRGGIPEDPGMTHDRLVAIVAGATDPMKIRENYARDILGRDPIAKPGERFAYSNAGYALLGVMAERAMHRPYEALVRDLIFKPLGMTHSYTSLDKMPEDRPSGHVRGEGPKPAWEPANFSGPMEYLFAPAGGGMFCSSGDLVRFGQMHMEGLQGHDVLLSSATIKRLHRGIPEDFVASGPQPSSEILQPTLAELQRDGRLYACGWGIEAVPGAGIMHTHNGSNGTMRAQVAIFPESGIVIAAFVNCGGESEPSPPLQAVIAVARRYARK